MKNAAKLAPKLKQLAKTTAKKFPPAKAGEKLGPLDALVLGLLRYEASEATALAAHEAIAANFVDFNDLRVATELEVAEVLVEAYGERAHPRATLLRIGLSNVFDRVGRLALDEIAGLSRREVRPALQRAVGLDHAAGRDEADALAFGESHVALLALDFGTLPIDQPARRWLLDKKVIDASADEQEVSRFCEQNLKLDDCRTLFAATRASASASAGDGAGSSAG